MTGLTTRWRFAIPLILLASLAIAAACGSGNDADDSGPDGEPLTGVAPSDTASFLALLNELELDWVVPEIALQRDWAEQSGSLVQITEPRSEWELYEFNDAASLDRFVGAARAGEIGDLPDHAFGWTSDSVVFFLRAAEQSPEAVQRFVSLFGEPIFGTDSAVVVVEPTEESAEPEPFDTGGESGPRPARPPDAVIAVGAEAVRAGIGTYCWTGTNEAICADSIGLITGLGTLNISPSEPFVLQAELDWDTARQINVRAWSRDAAVEIGAGDDWRAWSKRGEGIALPFAVSGGQLQLTADLSPGAYIVGVSILVEDGDVSYGFLLNVEAEGELNGSGSDSALTDPVDEPAKDPGFEQVRVPAPIDAVEINIAESFPVQYFVAIQSGLPSGCAFFDGIETSIGDDEIRIDVWNLEPTPTEPIACTAIYGIVDNNVALGSDFESGREYAVIVNGEVRATFVTQ